MSHNLLKNAGEGNQKENPDDPEPKLIPEKGKEHELELFSCVHSHPRPRNHL